MQVGEKQLLLTIKVDSELDAKMIAKQVFDMLARDYDNADLEEAEYIIGIVQSTDILGVGTLIGHTG